MTVADDIDDFLFLVEQRNVPEATAAEALFEATDSQIHGRGNHGDDEYPASDGKHFCSCGDVVLDEATLVDKRPESIRLARMFAHRQHRITMRAQFNQWLSEQAPPPLFDFVGPGD